MTDAVNLEEVSLELSSRCFGKCIHCSSSSSLEAGEDELNKKEWLEIIDQSFDLGADLISLSGGDPFAYPYWKEIVRYCYLNDFPVLFYTIGIKSLVPLEMIGREELSFLQGYFRSGSKLIFSMEGIGKTHDRIIGREGHFKKLVELIRLSKEMDFTVELHFTPMRPNLEDIPNFLQLAEEEDIDRVSFLRLVPQGRAKLNKMELMPTPAQFLGLQNFLYSYEGEVDFRIGCPLSFGHLIGTIKERPRCHAGQDLMLIRPDGDIHACAGWKECKQLVLGNVRKESLKDIWEDSKVLNLIREINQEEKVEGYCQGCPFFGICGGGCPAQRIIHNQEIRGIKDPQRQIIEGVDPMCPLYNQLINAEAIFELRKGGQFEKEQNRKGVIKNGN